MNVIISNRYKELLVGLDIDVIKSMSGEFDVDDLISTFSNFFFNKMVLDITAIKNYQDVTNLQKLSMAISMNKVILLLDESDTSSSNSYLSKLISMGIYNFTKNVDDIKFLIDNPNTYKDVAQYHQLNGENNNSAGSSNKEVSVSNNQVLNTTVIGFKNVTGQAGSTTLVYMLKKQLSRNYKTLAIEINKHDFAYFNDSELISTDALGLENAMSRVKGAEIVLIDINDLGDELFNVCKEVIYLIEPSTIKLGKMVKQNRMVFDKLRGKRIVLNKSLLEKKDIMDFEYESKSEIFYSIPPLDDRINRHKVLDDFMAKLGFRGGLDEEGNTGSGILKGIFRK